MNVKNKKAYVTSELIQHVRFLHRQAMFLGALLTDEEIDKSWAVINKLEEIIKLENKGEN